MSDQKMECFRCKGKGEVKRYDSEGSPLGKCPTCNGTGIYPEFEGRISDLRESKVGVSPRATHICEICTAQFYFDENGEPMQLSQGMQRQPHAHRLIPL